MYNYLKCQWIRKLYSLIYFSNPKLYYPHCHPILPHRIPCYLCPRVLCITYRPLYNYILLKHCFGYDWRTLWIPMTICPLTSVHGILSGKRKHWTVACLLQGTFPTQPNEPISLMPCIGRWVLHHKHHLTTYISHPYRKGIQPLPSTKKYLLTASCFILLWLLEQDQIFRVWSHRQGWI